MRKSLKNCALSVESSPIVIGDPPYVILPVACTLPVTVKVPPVTSCNFFGALLGGFASMYALSLSDLDDLLMFLLDRPPP